MRTLLLTGAALALVAGSTAVRAADIYPPAPGYAEAPTVYAPPPAPNYGPPPPPAYHPLPRYGYAPPVYAPQPGYAPPVYGPPPVVAYDDEAEAVPPHGVYRDAPAYAHAPRLYRDCWWEWGERRCVTRRGW